MVKSLDRLIRSLIFVLVNGKRDTHPPIRPGIGTLINKTPI